MFVRILRFLVLTTVAIAAIGGALLWWLIYTPRADAPQLSGEIAKGSIESGGRVRTYLLYAPQELAPGAPLLVVMHGSRGDAVQMRAATGYGFERLADAHGFAVVYPEGYEGFWNACNIVGDYSANLLDIDDVGFLTALSDELIAEIGSDPTRIFAAGLSRGGHMAFRLAIEAPSRFRAVAAMGANVPAPENFKCKASERSSSVMIMNGRKDPLNPFGGGEVTLFGFIKRGQVLSSRASAEYFATLNKMAAPPVDRAQGGVDHVSWRNDAGVEVELVAHGGGHVVPQAWQRYPRLLGPTPRDLNGPEVVWEFFERQPKEHP